MTDLFTTLRRFLSRDRRRALRSLREMAKQDEARAREIERSNATWRMLARGLAKMDEAEMAVKS